MDQQYDPRDLQITVHAIEFRWLRVTEDNKYSLGWRVPLFQPLDESYRLALQVRVNNGEWRSITHETGDDE